MDLTVLDKEYYEINHIPETSYHPHPELRDFKILVVLWRSFDGVLVCKWPSIESLAFFFKDRLQIAPTFDKELRLITQYDATRLLKRRIDSEQLCFYDGWSPDAWLHHQAMERLNAAMGKITIEHTKIEHTNRIEHCYLYAIDHDALPQQLRDGVLGFVRFALVVKIQDGVSVANPTVEIRIPSMASLQEFMSSPNSILFPCFESFDTSFTISLATASSCLIRKVHRLWWTRLGKRRHIWINEVDQQKYSNMLSGASVE